MTEPAPRWTDEKSELIVSILLQVGVIAASTLVLLGGVMYLFEHSTAEVDLHTFKGEPPDLRSLEGVVQDILKLRPLGIIQLGILVLLATPVARVAFSVYAFLRQRDYLYMAFTLLVLGILLFSLFAKHSAGH